MFIVAFPTGQSSFDFIYTFQWVSNGQAVLSNGHFMFKKNKVNMLCQQIWRISSHFLEFQNLNFMFAQLDGLVCLQYT